MQKVKDITVAYQPAAKPFTYRDYQQLPGDSFGFQVINGELVMCPSPVPSHQRTILRLASSIGAFLHEKDIGEVFLSPLDVVFDDFNVVQPDILYVAKENAGIITDENIQGAPDLVIEVLSPTTMSCDLDAKKNIYARFGVREYWVIDPQQQWLEVFENRDGAFVSMTRASGSQSFRSNVLRGFELNLRQIF